MSALCGSVRREASGEAPFLGNLGRDHRAPPGAGEARGDRARCGRLRARGVFLRFHLGEAVRIVPYHGAVRRHVEGLYPQRRGVRFLPQGVPLRAVQDVLEVRSRVLYHAAAGGGSRRALLGLPRKAKPGYGQGVLAQNPFFPPGPSGGDAPRQATPLHLLPFGFGHGGEGGTGEPRGGGRSCLLYLPLQGRRAGASGDRLPRVPRSPRHRGDPPGLPVRSRCLPGPWGALRYLPRGGGAGRRQRVPGALQLLSRFPS
jgi:hypothetical protein